jgi:hypothetical protein
MYLWPASSVTEKEAVFQVGEVEDFQAPGHRLELVAQDLADAGEAPFAFQGVAHGHGHCFAVGAHEGP